jgi:tetratricopeptide (TPR) repeat protein
MKHGQCLTEETLTDYLEGGLDPVVKAACEVHLIACDKCRESLALFMRVLQPENTPDEQHILQVISRNWDSRKARTLPERKNQSIGRKGWFLSLAGVAALVVFGFVALWTARDPQSLPQSAREVVQILLAENRPFEARMAEQPHLPIVRTRGIESPGVDYDLLAGEMTELAADSYQWGRFYLLQKQFEVAIPHLETAEKDPSAPAEVHNDLGVAYMEGGAEADLAKAAEEFAHALNRNPEFAPAVFNLSIFYEKSGRLAEAEMQWRRYLQLDSDSGWATEIRSKLEGLSR